MQYPSIMSTSRWACGKSQIFMLEMHGVIDDDKSITVLLIVAYYCLTIILLHFRGSQ